MSSNNYVNAAPIPMTLGDIGNPIIIQLGDGNYMPTDYSSYPNIIVTAILTAKNNPETQYASIICTNLDPSIGQFLFPGFSAGILTYNRATDIGTAPGSYELSFIVDYYGDTTSRVSSVDGLLAIRLYNSRPSS